MASKYLNFITPIGSAKYPRLDQPYSWNEAAQRTQPDPEGQYECAIVMTKADAKPLIDLIKQACEEAGIKPKNLPYKEEIDRDSQEPTGNIEFKVKAYGKTKAGEKNIIRLFDAKGRPVPSKLAITSGSTIRCLGWVSVARLGARLNLREVQIINLAEGAVSGFEAVEGGFVYEADEDDTPMMSNPVEANEESHLGAPF
ncbi:hypothetical protein UFOVP63_3 [uncultured Caudovirales phage]|uniref:Single-stranded DNA-binding protein n=1 Tax=uncultured Caudovirales phage TaxID=2100421 RepID=A0A6J5KTX3_9CAUD|nr:hypothetical protein UFOVP63_3 [uncultured Caudovirales phage]